MDRLETSSAGLDSSTWSLPAQLATFIGRERECSELASALERARLLTLVGTGGVGKTRLALEVARRQADKFLDGVLLVELGSLSEPALVAPTVAACLGLRDVPQGALEDSLLSFLARKRLLLVLDNCEHLVLASAELATRLLQGCPRLAILATSRQPLSIAGEKAWLVPPLAVPGSAADLGTDELAGYDAVHLFCERARSIVHGFALTDRNGETVTQICRRLDGIPLAIELASVRLRLLSPEQILERLNDRFRLLVGGSRTAPSRQQTLRATLDWSFALLDESEKTLLQRLSVFADGWSVEAAEAVAAGGSLASEDVLDVLGSLVDQSLVTVERQENGTRHRLLETVREYAVERLRESGEESSLLERHGGCYLALAERAESELTERNAPNWPDRLEQERDNLRAALGWARSVSPSSGLRMAASLGSFWELRGHLTDGRRWLEELLSLVPERTAIRAKALRALGEIMLRADLFAARAALEESVSIHAELGDSRDYAAALSLLGTTTWKLGERAVGLQLMDDSVELSRRIGDRTGIGRAQTIRGMCGRAEGEYDSARVKLEEGVALLRPGGDVDGLAFALNQLGQLARAKGDYATARRLLEESLGLFQAIGSRPRLALTLQCLGNVARLQHDGVRAEEELRQAMTLAHSIGAHFYLAASLVFAGILAIQRGQDARGLRLFGAATQYPNLRAALDADEVEDWDASLARACERVGLADLERLQAEGLAMAFEDAIAYATASAELPAADNGGPLSRRELEVAILIARGWSNREIGEELVISERTVEAHVTHMLNKLGVRTRAQVAVWASTQGARLSS